MFEYIIKSVPIKYIILNGKEVSINLLYGLLEQFEDEKEIKQYDIVGNYDIADILVEIGILEFYVGSRKAKIYQRTEKFVDFYNEFMDDFYAE